MTRTEKSKKQGACKYTLKNKTGGKSGKTKMRLKKNGVERRICSKKNKNDVEADERPPRHMTSTARV